MGFVDGTDVPVGHLDYEYVRNCSDDAELEKILKILRYSQVGVAPRQLVMRQSALFLLFSFLITIIYLNELAFRTKA